MNWYTTRRIRNKLLSGSAVEVALSSRIYAERVRSLDRGVGAVRESGGRSRAEEGGIKKQLAHLEEALATKQETGHEN